MNHRSSLVGQMIVFLDGDLDAICGNLYTLDLTAIRFSDVRKWQENGKVLNGLWSCIAK